MLLEIVIPEQQVLSVEVGYVSMPGQEGEFGVYPMHIPLVAGLHSGILRYDVGSQKNYMAIHGGYAEVTGNGVTVIADCCERSDDIDYQRAKEAEKRAKAALERKSEQDTAKLEAKLFRSLTRQSVYNRRQ